MTKRFSFSNDNDLTKALFLEWVVCDGYKKLRNHRNGYAGCICIGMVYNDILKIFVNFRLLQSDCISSHDESKSRN